MSSKSSDEILREFLAVMRGRLGERLRQVLLFGSRGRGDASVESDFDLLIVLDKMLPEVEEVVDEVSGDFLYRYDVVLSILPVPEELFRRQVHEPLFINIRQEGKVLWGA